MSIQPFKDNISDNVNVPKPLKKSKPPSTPPDVIGVMLSNLSNKDRQSMATTQKNLTSITIHQLKNLSASEFTGFINKLNTHIDQICEKLENQSEIEDLKKIKEEISKLTGKEILGSTNLLQIKSSMTGSKIALAKIVTNLPRNVLDEFAAKEKESISETAKDVLALSILYKKLEAAITNPDESAKSIALEKIATKLAKLGDLATAFQTACHIDSEFSQDDFLKKIMSSEDHPISERLLDELVEIVDKMPSSYFKEMGLSMIAGEFINKRDFDKSLNVIAKISDEKLNSMGVDIPIKLLMMIGVISQIALKGEPERAKEMLSSINFDALDDAANETKENMIKFISERSENQSIIREFNNNKGFVDKDEIDQVLEAVNKITDIEKKSKVLTALIEELTYNKFFKEANAIAKTLPDEAKKESLLELIKREKGGWF